MDRFYWTQGTKTYRKGGINIVIMHKQSKWHEAQPSASDEASALLLLSNLGRKHNFQIY